VILNRGRSLQTVGSSVSVAAPETNIVPDIHVEDWMGYSTTQRYRTGGLFSSPGVFTLTDRYLTDIVLCRFVGLLSIVWSARTTRNLRVEKQNSK
jgi:hypothetical protein